MLQRRKEIRKSSSKSCNTRIKIKQIYSHCVNMNPDCNFFAYDLVFDYDFVFDYTEKIYNENANRLKLH